MVMACPHSSPYALPSDEELAGRASVGSRHATEVLLTRYRPLVESKARAYFLMGADHDDVVQEGMIGLYKAIRDFRAERLAHFRAFADLCVTRQIISAVKTATRQKHAMLTTCISLNHTLGADGDSDSALLETLPDRRAPDPQQCLLAQRENGGRLDAIRATLSPLEIQVLDCYLQGKSYREMSSELRCQTKAVDNALQRVKRKIGQTALPD